MDINLKVGDVSENGQITIIDEDRLCYLVKSISKGAEGIRIISKSLLLEYVEYFTKNPNASATEARDALCGRSDIDKFEYGYTSTLKTMAQMALGLTETVSSSLGFISPKKISRPLQTIYYGAPGTGKSYIVDEMCKTYTHFRTTFHPDSDYSTFVGCFKPSSEMVPYSDNVQLKNELQLTNLWNSSQLSFHEFVGANYKSLNALSKNEWENIFITNASEDKKTTNSVVGVETNKAIKAVKEFVNTLKQESRIIYNFVPQAFTTAYLEAWKLHRENRPVYLIVEEINRGNCAQIFGDLFQLLDRDENGYSKYEITPDTDLQKYIAEQELSLSDIHDSDGKDISVQVVNGTLMKLPNNLHIWATMNTSDQSLFPMDSAFKRRWEWEYVKIAKGIDKNGNELDWRIGVQTGTDWWDFIQKINAIIASMTSSADKQLGYFFCKADDKGVISYKTFVNKVCFYLWNDVFKDYGFEDKDLFRYEVTNDSKKEAKDLTFPDFFDDLQDDGICKSRVDDFIQKVLDWKSGKGEYGN